MLSIASCGRAVSDYTKVYNMDTNLTVGYNLIVLPVEKRLLVDEGDIVGFYRSTSGAALQRNTAGQDTGVYFIPAQNSSNYKVDLKSWVALNASFRVKLHGSKTGAVTFTTCLKSVGLHSLMMTFTNTISKALTLQHLIRVQNPISQLSLAVDSIYILVNTTKNITATVTQGTNVSCEWYIPNSSLTVLQSPYQENNSTTEGGVFQYSASYRFVGHIPVVVTVSNRVSKKKNTIILYVREPIQGLQVCMCHAAFAFDNAKACFNSSVNRGTEIGCTWYFKRNDFIEESIGKTITHEFTPVGVRNFTLYCYNKISMQSVTYPVQVIANPLSIDAPLKVPADELVKITCQVNWSGGTPASFFAQHGVTGKTGTDIVADPILTLQAYSYSNSSRGHVTIYKSFKKNYRKNKVTCKADNYPDLNVIHTIRAIYRITGINVTSFCSSRVEAGTECAFQIQLFRGDTPSFTWTVTEGDSRVSVHSGRIIRHRFISTGVANVTVNASNEVSSRVNTTHFFVYLPFTREPHVTTSPLIPLLQSSAMLTSSPAVSKDVSRHSIHGIDIATAILSTSPTPTSTSSTTGIPHQIPSLKDAGLSHDSVEFVGHAITFSVRHITQPHLVRFLWSWGDESALEEAGYTLTHTFTDPGHYLITVNISSAVDHVVLYGNVTVQYRIEGLLITDLAVTSTNVLDVKFEILRGTNVTYSVEYGDNTGE